MEEENKIEEEKIEPVVNEVSNEIENNQQVEQVQEIETTIPPVQTEEVQAIENNVQVEVEQQIEKTEPVVQEEVHEEVKPVVEQTIVNNTYEVDDEEEYVEEPKKKKKNPLLLFIIAIIILAILAVVFLLLNPFKKKNTEKIVYELNDPVIQKIVRPFLYGGEHCFFYGEKLNSDHLIRLRVAYESIDTARDELDCSEVGGLLFDTNEKGQKVLNAYCGGSPSQEMVDAYSQGDLVKFQEEANKNTTDSVTADRLKEQYFKIFSDKYSYSDASFGMGTSIEPKCKLMSYVENKNLYALYSGQCEATCNGSQILTNAYEENDVLYIYTDYTDDKNVTTRVVYTFIKNGDKYLFDKVKEEKDVE